MAVSSWGQRNHKAKKSSTRKSNSKSVKNYMEEVVWKNSETTKTQHWIFLCLRFFDALNLKKNNEEIFAADFKIVFKKFQ